MNTSIDNEIKLHQNGGKKKRLLLHVCCAPCLCGTMEKLLFHFEVTAYFYNPNIIPIEEFNLRLSAVKDLIVHYPQIKLIVPQQDVGDYLECIKGLEQEDEGGARCARCFELRLYNTAQFLANNDFDFYATTLTVSPHKNAVVINEIGSRIAESLGITYLCSDFKKQDGYLKSIILSKELKLYRQTYCGCKTNHLPSQ